MEKIKNSTLDFLKAMKENNNREWFLQHRPQYLAAKENYEHFVQGVIDSITEFEPILKGLEVSSCVYRFYRDIRFSSDKSPYKSHLGAFIVKGGKQNGDKYAGYYVHVEPGASMLAGGAYMPPAGWLTAIRESVDDDPERLVRIINAADFKKYFGNLDGEKLKKAPKGYPSDHPHLELLKYKSYLAVNEVSDELVTSEDFFDHVISVCRAMKPLNDFLNSRTGL